MGRYCRERSGLRGLEKTLKWELKIPVEFAYYWLRIVNFRATLHCQIRKISRNPGKSARLSAQSEGNLREKPAFH